jgi:hypothetical protein
MRLLAGSHINLIKICAENVEPFILGVCVINNSFWDIF